MTHLSLRGCQQLTDHALPHLVVLTALRQLNLTACERMSGEQGHQSLHNSAVSAGLYVTCS